MRRTALILAAFILAWATGAGGEASGAEKLRIGFHRLVYGAFDVVAWKKGYLDEALGKGNYVMNPFASGKLMMEALLSNSVDVAHAADRAYLGAVAAGGRLAAIAVHSTTCATMHVMVDLKSPIRSVQELKGKRLAAGKGTGGYFAFSRLVAPAVGLEEKDWVLVNTKPPDRVSALRAGQVEASIVNEPAASAAVAQGVAKSLTTFCQWTELPWAVVANPRTLERSPDLLAKYLRAWKKAVDLKERNLEEFARVHWEYQKSKGFKGSLGTVKSSISLLGRGGKIGERFYIHFERMGKALVADGELKRVPNLRGGEGVNVSVWERAMGPAN